MNIRATLHLSLLFNFGSNSSLQYFYPLQFILNTAAGVILLSPKSDHITSLLKTATALHFPQRSLLWLRGPHDLVLLPPDLTSPFSPFSPATLGPLLYPAQARRPLFSGPCDNCLSGMIFPRHHIANILTLSESLFSCHLPNEIGPTYYSNLSLPSWYSPVSLPCPMFALASST